jgi:hypothetical protein
MLFLHCFPWLSSNSVIFLVKRNSANKDKLKINHIVGLKSLTKIVGGTKFISLALTTNKFVIFPNVSIFVMFFSIYQ